MESKARFAVIPKLYLRNVNLIWQGRVYFHKYIKIAPIPTELVYDVINNKICMSK